MKISSSESAKIVLAILTIEDWADSPPTIGELKTSVKEIYEEGVDNILILDKYMELPELFVQHLKEFKRLLKEGNAEKALDELHYAFNEWSEWLYRELGG